MDKIYSTVNVEIEVFFYDIIKSVVKLRTVNYEQLDKQGKKISKKKNDDKKTRQNR